MFFNRLLTTLKKIGTMQELIALVLSLFVVGMFVNDGKNGLLWQMKVIAYSLDDTWFNYLTFDFVGYAAIIGLVALYFILLVLIKLAVDFHNGNELE